MSIKLTKGTKEVVPVDVEDLEGFVNDLSGASPKFDLLNSSNTLIYNQEPATANGMTISCLVDTSATGPGGLLPIGLYRLFVSWTLGSEKPREGPVAVYIVDEVTTNG